MAPLTDDEIVALLASLAQPIPGRPGHVVVAVQQVRTADAGAVEAVERWAAAHGRLMRRPIVNHVLREPQLVGPVTGYVIPRTALLT